MDLILSDETKNQILELINKFPGVFRNYDENNITMLKNNIISKEMCITALENVMYNCQCMRATIKSHSIYDSSYNFAENIYLSIPKSPDYNENSGIFYENIPEFKSMSNEMLLSTLSEAFKVQVIFTNVLKHQSFTSRAERILQSIESIQNQTIELSETEKNNLENIYVDIKKQLSSNQNINLQSLNNTIALYNDVATYIWNRYLDNGRCYLVHNYSRGHIENFIPSKYLSTSLITDKFMALFQENYNNNYGFIVKPKKIISAYYKDTFTHNRSENVGTDMYSSGIVPPILFPWEIEKEAIQNSINMNGEILNYDDGYVLPEIVLEDYELIGVYYRTNGEGKLSPSYEAACELAKSKGLELKEIDMSFARMQVGLEPMTTPMRQKFFLNIIRKNYMQEKDIKKHFGRSNPFDKLEDEETITKYLDVMYATYINLRKAGKLNEETLLKTITSTISLEDMSIIKNFYRRYTENHNDLSNKTTSDTIEPNKSSKQQIDDKTSLIQQQPISYKSDIESKNLTNNSQLNESSPQIEKKPFSQRSLSELKIVQLIRMKNQAIAQQRQQQKQASKGYMDIVILSLIISFCAGMLTMIIFSILK